MPPPISPGQPFSASPARKLLVIFVWIYCLSWAFDFRATATGGTAAQFIMFSLSMGAALAVIILAPKQLLVKPTGWFILGWGGYLLSTGVVAVVNHVPMDWYVRNLQQPLLVLMSLCVTQVAASSGLHYRHVLIPMLIAGVVNIIWRIVYSVIFGGLALDEVRVEILSQALPFVLAFSFIAAALRPGKIVLPLLVGCVGLGSYVLSITRSAIFVILAQFAACALAWWKSRQLGLLPAGFNQAKVRHLGIGLGILVLALIIVGVATPYVIDRWTERLFYTVGADYSSMDPSALTRLAEMKSFYTLMNDQPSSYFYGLGLGHYYYWDEAYIPELLYTYPDYQEFRDTCREIHFPGHSMWAYSVFSGGVIGLLAFVGLFMGGAIMAYRASQSLKSAPDFPLEIAFLPFVALIGFLSLSFTFNPFIERASCIALGVSVAFPQFLIAHAWNTRPRLSSRLQPLPLPVRWQRA